MTRNKIVVPFISASDSDVPIIKFHIGATIHYAIIDTGAESTIFNTSLSSMMDNCKEEEISIVGVAGETTPTTIQHATTRIWMQNNEGHVLILVVSGYINDISHLSDHFLPNENIKIDAILGSDMLNEFQAKINYNKKEIYFKL